MNRALLRQIVVATATIVTIGFNILANALPLNGLDTGEISDRFDIFFVPAGYVFAIWFIIYVGLITYTVYQARASQRENPRLKKIAPWYLLAAAANIVWLFLWHYEYFSYTLIAMATLLISLIVIYLQLDVGGAEVPRAERWSVHVPFSIYLGWITVATIANTTQLLFFLGWDGFGLAPEAWAAIMLGAGVVISALMSLTRADIAYSLVLVWAYIGIAVKFPDVSTVSLAAWISVVLILVILAAGYLRRSKAEKTLSPA
ncbi:MAG: hypothetical protein R3335_08205 [Anaerolineales bacterium]|nr:hypothetical protein [Anaerolineales bacterium]